MRLLDDIRTGPARPRSVSGLKWSTRIQATGEVQHAGWTKSRGPVTLKNSVDPYGYHFVNVNTMVLAIQSNDRGTKDVVLW